jgi:hypothetical protein
MGVYVITQPSITRSTGEGCKISLACQDKMCLLNGTMGGNLPASVVFDEYDQEIGHLFINDSTETYPPVEDPNNYNIYHYNNKQYYYDYQYGWIEIKNASDISSDGKVTIRTPIYDIIQTAVMNYGGEAMNRIIINDIPQEIKQITTYLGSLPLYYNPATKVFTFNESNVKEGETWHVFHYKDEIGYSWVPFVYPYANGNSSNGSALTTSLGDNVCTVLDKIAQLGNYEYFYDVDGNFVFQEIKNYLNNSYNPLKDQNNMKPYYIDNNKSVGSENIANNNIKIIGAENYEADYFGDQKSAYTFTEDNGLVISYSNNPDYSNIKNDFHIWGKNQNNNVLHYHLAIKEIPKKEYYDEEGILAYPEREVVFSRGEDHKFTGKIRMLQKEDFIGLYADVVNGGLDCKDNTVTYVTGNTLNIAQNSADIKNGINVSQTNTRNENGQVISLNQIAIRTDGVVKKIRANDWRAELYLRGLQKIHDGERPDKYEQELLDFFDTIYEWGFYDTDKENPQDSDFKYSGRFKTDIVNTPNELNYFLDFLEPVGTLYGMSVDDIGSKIYSFQSDKTSKLYNDEVPDTMLINLEWSKEYQEKIRKDCTDQGQPFSNIDKSLYDSCATNIIGYTAQEKIREFLYQYTNYNESITIQSLPIYYLDVNQRITVEDAKTGIIGDYITKQITLPLVPNGTMNITAVKAINRI